MTDRLYTLQHRVDDVRMRLQTRSYSCHQVPRVPPHIGVDEQHVEVSVGAGEGGDAALDKLDDSTKGADTVVNTTGSTVQDLLTQECSAANFTLREVVKNT